MTERSCGTPRRFEAFARTVFSTLPHAFAASLLIVALGSSQVQAQNAAIDKFGNAISRFHRIVNQAESFANYLSIKRCATPADYAKLKAEADQIINSLDSYNRDVQQAYDAVDAVEVNVVTRKQAKYWDDDLDRSSEAENDIDDSLYRLLRHPCPPETISRTAPPPMPVQTGYLTGEIAKSYAQEGWTIVLGGNVGVGQSSNHYEDFPRFDGDGWSAGASAAARYYFSNGWFIGPEAGGMALGVNGTNPDGAFSKIGSMTYEGGQVGYSLSAPGATPINVYVGAAAAQASVNVGIDTRGFFESMRKTLDGWTVHTGLEFRPAPVSAPNWKVGVEYRYAYVSGDIGGDPVSAHMHLLSATTSYEFSLGH